MHRKYRVVRLLITLLALSLLSACGGGGGGGSSTGGGGGFTLPDGTSASGGAISPAGTLTVDVTDYSDGASLSGATVIVDHPLDGRQVQTTTSPVTFTITSGGPVTVTVGKSGYEIWTFIDINASNIHVALENLNLQAFIQGNTVNFTGPNGLVETAVFGDGDWWESCPTPTTCQDLSEGTNGFYKLGVELPNRIYAVSAFDFAAGFTPINFTALTDIGPLTNGQTLVRDLTFPAIPPASTLTTGSITVPASLGTIDEIIAVGLSDLGTQRQGELIVGFSSIGMVSPYNYNLTTFAFTGGVSDDIGVSADGVSGAATLSIQRGIGFGGSGVIFNLLDIPTNLAPSGSCGSVTPAFSWTAVPGASVYLAYIEGIPSDWQVAIASSATSFTLPDLTGTALASEGLSSGVPITWGLDAIVVPGFDFNSFELNAAIQTFTDLSNSIEVTCIP